jgi:hypothetical protein
MGWQPVGLAMTSIYKRTFWQLIVTIETTPAFLRGFEQFEDDGQRGPVGQASLRLDRAVAHGSEVCFQWDWSSAGVSSARPGKS